VVTKTSAALVAGGSVSEFNLSPGGLNVSYIADQDSDDKLEIYNVDLATAAVSVKLNPVSAGTGTFLLQTGADGAQAFYIADQNQASAFELFSVEIANPGVATTLSDPDVAGGVLADFAIAPGLRGF
jgi:hypothetical protein